MKPTLLLSLFALVATASVFAREIPLVTDEGFAVPQPGREFTFPRDHGSHPEFKIEWWYVTGHLHAEGGRRFGYQATFFRQAGPEGAQLYMAHMALIDIRANRFVYQERLNREGWDASASTDTLDVRNGPWTMRMTDPATERMELRGGIRAEARFDLVLTPAKPLVIFGEDGVSRKGAALTASSHYVTFTRLRTEGTLTVGAETFAVTGLSWMDHEFSSSQLDEGQIGWDWVSVHFDDERELMFYRLRLRDGTSDPASSLTWIDRESNLTKSDHAWEVLDTWRSPRTGGVYPVRVRLTTTDPADGRRRAFTLEPFVRHPELTGGVGGIAYWEGAMRVLDETGREVGSAFMELTGYAAELRL